jgi:hypothetical protein
VTDAGLEAVAAGLPQLHALEVTELPLTARSLMALASHCPKLTHLVPNATAFSSGPLDCYSRRTRTPHAPHSPHTRAPHMQALRRCGMIDDAALAAFFAALPTELRRKRLRTLDISYCPRLTPAALAMLASNRTLPALLLCPASRDRGLIA